MYSLFDFAYLLIEYSEDDIGRTVAIIVGILAGLALFVVFISFFKGACKCHFYFIILAQKWIRLVYIWFYDKFNFYDTYL